MKTVLSMTVIVWALGGAVSMSPAHAGGIKCDKASKKIKWNMCVLKEVKYKRGLKTVSRTECAVIKPIKASNGCNLGDVYRHIPKGTSFESVVFYAIGPKGFDTRGYEIQRQADESMCGIKASNIDAYSLMKFSDAFDKDNRERGLMVEAKLAKKKKMIMKTALRIQKSPYEDCKGRKALVGQVDRKSQSKFLFYAESNIPK